MSNKPAILSIPGAFGMPELYDAMVNAVAAQGHSIRALHLPSVGYQSGVKEPPCMEDDVAFSGSEISKLADQGKDVVLITHSYCGMPVTQSTKGLGEIERQVQGKKGGIVRLAYMSSIVLPLGASDASVLLDSDASSRERRVELRIDICQGMKKASIAMVERETWQQVDVTSITAIAHLSVSQW